MRTGIRVSLALLSALGIGCASYQRVARATKSIWSVRVTSNPVDVKTCRHLTFVDSTDSQRGCGLTVQPTPEECLRYQVTLAGGDTLLSKGLVGEAYDCSGRSAAASTPSATPGASPVPEPSATPLPSPTPQLTAVPPTPEASPSAKDAGVQIVQSREMVKGCVYLDEVDLKTECPAEDAGARRDCIADRAARAGGNTALIDGSRALVFSCKVIP